MLVKGVESLICLFSDNLSLNPAFVLYGFEKGKCTTQRDARIST